MKRLSSHSFFIFLVKSSPALSDCALENSLGNPDASDAFVCAADNKIPKKRKAGTSGNNQAKKAKIQRQNESFAEKKAR